MPHPDEGLIHAWLDGELDAAESARVEALAATDPEWTAAVAEARGLIAASARIVGSLDRVPANVIPKAAAPSPAPQARNRWMLRAAAAVVLIGGSAVVLNRASVDTVDIVIPVKAPPPPPADAPSAIAPVIAPPKELKKKLADSKSSVPKQELDAIKRNETTRDKDAGVAGAELRSTASAAGAAGAAGADVAAGRVSAARRADVAAAAAPAPASVAGAAKAQSSAAERSAPAGPYCFSQRAPADSVSRIIRLDAAALADSMRLEKLTLRGDTLAAVNGTLIAVLVRCPAP